MHFEASGERSADAGLQLFCFEYDSPVLCSTGCRSIIGDRAGESETGCAQSIRRYGSGVNEILFN
ncbi:MAG: hypothetical protein ACRD3W_18350, partial [Terriglobales bacterium]